VNRNEIFVKVKNFQIMDLLGGNSIVIDKSISSQLKGKTVLITGAAGDIGCEIVWQVLAFALKNYYGRSGRNTITSFDFTG
jgi:FlaA1/EpsC-like NDP-sugar epimerase